MFGRSQGIEHTLSLPIAAAGTLLEALEGSEHDPLAAEILPGESPSAEGTEGHT